MFSLTDLKFIYRFNFTTFSLGSNGASDCYVLNPVTTTIPPSDDYLSIALPDPTETFDLMPLYCGTQLANQTITCKLYDTFIVNLLFNN